jgi:hypothetical protein
MRLFVGTVGLGLCLCACGALTGLGDYSEGLSQHDGSAAPDAETTGDDASTADETSTPDPGDDAGPVEDAMIPADVDIDATPACGASNCPGCCMNGTCVGGHSVDTCGLGGLACIDCTSMGGACSSKGACTTPVVDAAPPATCSVSKCTPCIPVYQSACCKTSDQTCGCKTNFGGNGQCN